MSEAEVQGAGAENLSSEPGGRGKGLVGRLSLGGGRNVREFLPDGLDFLSEEECSDTLLRVRV